MLDKFYFFIPRYMFHKKSMILSFIRMIAFINTSK